MGAGALLPRGLLPAGGVAALTGGELAVKGKAAACEGLLAKAASTAGVGGAGGSLGCAASGAVPCRCCWCCCQRGRAGCCLGIQLASVSPHWSPRAEMPLLLLPLLLLHEGSEGGEGGG